MRCPILVIFVAAIGSTAHAQFASPFLGATEPHDVATRNAIVSQTTDEGQGTSQPAEEHPNAERGSATVATPREATVPDAASVVTSACHTQCNFDETVAKMTCARFRQDSGERENCVDQAKTSRTECDSHCK